MKVTAVVLSTVALVIVLGLGCSKASAPGPEKPATPDAAPSAAMTVSSAAGGSNADSMVLYEKSCSACHPLTKVDQYVGSKSWQAVMDQMINEEGAKISPEDAAKIVQHLEQTHPKK